MADDRSTTASAPNGGATPPTSSGHVDGVLVIGGGYAGVNAARAVSNRGVRATVLDPIGTYDFVTRLAAVAGGTAGPGDAAAPLADLVEHVRTGHVATIADGAVVLDDGTTLSADAVVVTAGAVPLRPDIPGLDLASPLRTSTDALELRDRIAGTDRLVIAGGGATGVQLAGAVSAAHPAIHVTVVDMADRLLTGMDEALADGAARILRDRGVDVLLERQVAEIGPDGVTLDDGTVVSGLVVWAAGFDARADQLGVDVHEDGRITVTDELLIAGMTRTFAAGDVARHLDDDGEPFAMAAQIAVQAGEQAGRNAARLVRNQELKPAKLVDRGWVLDLGGGRGLAEVGPINLAAPVLDRIPPFLHLLIDLKNLADIGGLRVVTDHHPNAEGSLASAVFEPIVAAVRR